MQKKYKKKPNGKNDTGRPTKLTNELLRQLEELVNKRGWEVLTDEEICDEIGIDQQTKQNWINADYMDEDKMKFFGLIKKARRRAKIGLARRIGEGENGWQGSAWIAERKFDDLNLRRKYEGDINDKKQLNNFIKDIREELEREAD